MNVNMPAQEMPFEEWLKLDLETARTEWVDGKAVFYPLSNQKHQELSRFLSALLSFFVESRDRLGRIFVDSFAMRPGPRTNARCPDLVFVHRDHLDRVQHTYLKGPADLVVEIISPDSVRRDCLEKLPSMKPTRSRNTGSSTPSPKKPISTGAPRTGVSMPSHCRTAFSAARSCQVCG